MILAEPIACAPTDIATMRALLDIAIREQRSLEWWQAQIAAAPASDIQARRKPKKTYANPLDELLLEPLRALPRALRAQGREIIINGIRSSHNLEDIRDRLAAIRETSSPEEAPHPGSSLAQDSRS
jgi:hypothetical protein